MTLSSRLKTSRIRLLLDKRGTKSFRVNLVIKLMQYPTKPSMRLEKMLIKTIKQLNKKKRRKATILQLNIKHRIKATKKKTFHTASTQTLGTLR